MYMGGDVCVCIRMYMYLFQSVEDGKNVCCTQGTLKLTSLVHLLSQVTVNCVSIHDVLV